MRYPNGQPVRVSTTVRDLSGNLVNAGALVLTVQKPDGTQQPYISPVNTDTGSYYQDIPASDLMQNGHYQYAWTATGAGAGVAAGDFDVYDPFEVRVISLQDAKQMLGIPAANTANDQEIEQWTAAIESGLEQFTGGPVVNRTVTERAELDGNYAVLLVRQRPLVSVTSIISVASGSAIDISAGLDIDPNAGTIRTRLGWPFIGPFFAFRPAMNVTYVAGWGTAVPAAFAAFARIVIQHLWETRRGPLAMPMGGEPPVVVPGFGFAIPARAAELLNGSLNGMPFRQEAYL